jgi:hypothetical protein
MWFSKRSGWDSVLLLNRTHCEEDIKRLEEDNMTTAIFNGDECEEMCGENLQESIEAFDKERMTRIFWDFYRDHVEIGWPKKHLMRKYALTTAQFDQMDYKSSLVAVYIERGSTSELSLLEAGYGLEDAGINSDNRLTENNLAVLAG